MDFYSKMNFLFQLLYNYINFLTQFGICYLCTPLYTLLSVTESQEHNFRTESVSHSSETKRIPINSLKLNTAKSNWNKKNPAISLNF